MGAKISSFGNALYDSKRRQFLGRDGAGWGKLGVFYFFFYLGLAGFFCAMLAVFMMLSPRDHPRYFGRQSCMRTRSNPLTPGLGFRPQPEVDKNIIVAERNTRSNDSTRYVSNLKQYLQVYYPSEDPVSGQSNDGNYRSGAGDRPSDVPKFVIRDPGTCTSANNYGYRTGRPCVLVKMNKIYGFVPVPGSAEDEAQFYNEKCGGITGTAVYCYGEYPADVDNIGPINYYSESGHSKSCGSLDPKWFPYKGKYNRQDYYEAPYVWVQFANPKPNVLINVICRIYGENILFDKKTSRGLTRFQVFVKAPPKQQRPSRSVDL